MSKEIKLKRVTKLYRTDTANVVFVIVAASIVLLLIISLVFFRPMISSLSSNLTAIGQTEKAIKQARVDLKDFEKKETLIEQSQETIKKFAKLFPKDADQARLIELLKDAGQKAGMDISNVSFSLPQLVQGSTKSKTVYPVGTQKITASLNFSGLTQFEEFVKNVESMDRGCTITSFSYNGSNGSLVLTAYIGKDVQIGGGE